jgi:hypothetical protein
MIKVSIHQEVKKIIKIYIDPTEEHLKTCKVNNRIIILFQTIIVEHFNILLSTMLKSAE